MSIKRILRKAAELVVEMPEQAEDTTHFESSQPATKSVEQIVRDTPGPNLDEIKIPEPEPTTASTPAAPAGQVDFVSVYAKAGLTPSPFSAEQAWDVINSLPPELPLDARRATVQATLSAMGKAMGVNTETVIADAGRKVAALSAYEDVLTHQAKTYTGAIESKIAGLEREIAMYKTEIEQTQAMLASAIEKCDAESAKLDDVLEFFSLDQGVSRNA